MKVVSSCLVVRCLAFTSSAATKIWTNPTGGNWSDGANWSPNGMPGAGDAAMITNSGTYLVNLDLNATILSLTLGGMGGNQTLSNNASTLRLSSESMVRSQGVMVLSGGTFSGPGGVRIAPGGQMILAGQGTKTFSALQLFNQGTVRWLAGTVQADNMVPGTVVTNSGLWQAEGNDYLYYPFGPPMARFYNNGTFRKGVSNARLGEDATLYPKPFFRRAPRGEAQEGGACPQSLPWVAAAPGLKG